MIKDPFTVIWVRGVSYEQININIFSLTQPRCANSFDLFSLISTLITVVGPVETYQFRELIPDEPIVRLLVLSICDVRISVVTSSQDTIIRCRDGENY